MKMTMSNTDQKAEVQVPYKGQYSFQNRALTSGTETGSYDQHFRCDVTDDADLFMTCYVYISNHEEPCAKSTFQKSGDDGEVAKKAVEMDIGHLLHLWEEN